jgi:hypothetical protein
VSHFATILKKWLPLKVSKIICAKASLPGTQNMGETDLG